jgi:hypothetical protein
LSYATAIASSALGLSAALAPPAGADVGIKSFSVTPSTTQAGIPSASSGPDLNIDAKFSSSWWDTPNKATISLAPGILANPQAASKCSATQFQSNQCPGSSWIGNGWTTATAPGFFGFTLPFASNAYLVAPPGSEPARIGLIINFFGWPVESATAPVQLRTTPGNVGLDIDFAGLPNLWNGISIVVDELQLTIRGSINNQIFTRNPTTCTAPATSTLTVVSYGNPSASPQATSTFTPTGCGSLSFKPQFSDSVLRDASDPGVQYTAQVNQSPFDAATRTIKITTPPSLAPIGVLTGAATCANVDITTCPAVGTASVSTPILPNPVPGKIVLVRHSGALPTVALFFQNPFPAEVDGTTAIVSPSPGVNQLVTTFDTLPDVPLTNLTLTLNGGQGSVFVGGTNICSGSQPATADFTAFNGATATQTVNTPVTPCP